MELYQIMLHVVIPDYKVTWSYMELYLIMLHVVIPDYKVTSRPTYIKLH